ncbi:MAG: ligase-associated DNA damage response endonuclease PdeM [Pelagimonas sp.]|uniref:ligase-associated DNA damage response endonuclease PdeM n=1 Tax=Pelagimonas sp. TaxID=2073170 RepID=UPI003D6AEDD8
MTGHPLAFHGADLRALASGALFWPDRALLVVSDLHFGKSARLSAVGGAQLPPYETRETLQKLETDLETTSARSVVCLGDSFDTPDVETALPKADRLWITHLQAGRDWVWIEGNHDPGPVRLGGAHLAQITIGPLTFRHIAASDPRAEISGHYHPKARIPLRGRSLTRPCFLVDQQRIILPAYGAFTGGLHSHSAALCALMAPNARAILTGSPQVEIAMPRAAT